MTFSFDKQTAFVVVSLSLMGCSSETDDNSFVGQNHTEVAETISIDQLGPEADANFASDTNRCAKLLPDLEAFSDCMLKVETSRDHGSVIAKDQNNYTEKPILFYCLKLTNDVEKENCKLIVKNQRENEVALAKIALERSKKRATESKAFREALEKEVSSPD